MLTNSSLERTPRPCQHSSSCKSVRRCCSIWSFGSMQTNDGAPVVLIVLAHGLSCALLDRVALISPPSARLVFCCVFLHLNLPSDHFISTFFSSLYPRQPLSLLSRSVTNSCYLDTTQLRKQAFTIVSPGQSPTCCPLPQTLQLSQVRHIRKSTHQLAVLRRCREPNPPTHHHAIRHATITAGRARGAASIMYSRPCASSGC